MQKQNLKKGLYAITDCQRLAYDEMLERTEAILRAGIAALQYRDKNDDTNLTFKTARKLFALCQRYETPLIINDDVELAEVLGAAGVHLGKDDSDYQTARERLGEDAIIGISCYNQLQTATDAQQTGFDYVAFGTLFPTTTKDNTVPASIELLHEAKSTLTIPVAAIGGITLDNCLPVIDTGIDLLATVSSVYLADDPYTVVSEFNKLLHK